MQTPGGIRSSPGACVRAASTAASILLYPASGRCIFGVCYFSSLPVPSTLQPLPERPASWANLQTAWGRGCKPPREELHCPGWHCAVMLMPAQSPLGWQCWVF